jgi:hypothetical protein
VDLVPAGGVDEPQPFRRHLVGHPSAIGIDEPPEDSPLVGGEFGPGDAGRRLLRWLG